MSPSKVDITMSMVEREAMNLANFVASKFGYQDHPMLKVALEYGKQMYGDKVKAFVSSVVETDSTMDASSEVLKEFVSNYIDDFQSRLKQKLEEKNAHVNVETQG